MQTRKIEYSHGKLTFKGELFWDEARTGARPGVVVYPEAFGLNDHTRERASRLAELGYVALAADFHGDGAEYTDMTELGPLLGALFADRAEWRARAQAALDALTAQPEVDGGKIAAIGFCFGGATALELARTGAALTAIVTFHAGLQPELAEDTGRIRSSVLICHGAEDPLLTGEVIQSVMDSFRRDQVDWQFIYYGNAVHSFTAHDADAKGVPGLAYHARTDARSWAAMTHLFDEVFND